MIVDLFAGPGGWSEGLRMLGRSELGIELDEHACATARAAGHERLQADVAALDPRDFPCQGLIGSPPCPTFSMGGDGSGRLLVDVIVRCARALARGEDTRRAAVAEAERLLLPGAKSPEHARRDAEMSVLVVEPLRWALALSPEWVALEQVPPVLPIWKVFAEILRAHGYSVWAGVLEAERYGVPQTRERAVLMASRTRTVHPPRATHQRFVAGEPQRHDVTLEGEILPWVSMAEALGWHPGDVYLNGTHDHRAEREASAPAPTLHFGARLNTVTRVQFQATNDRPNGCVREASEPAPTLAFGHERPRWLMQGGVSGEGRPRPAEEPAPSLSAKSTAYWTEDPEAWYGAERAEARERMDVPTGTRVAWAADRPATTVQGDPRVFAPGHKKNADDERAGRDGYEDRAGTNAIRVTIEEAGVLQSFPADYPWRGTSTKKFQQVGNAVPPLLARAILEELL